MLIFKLNLQVDDGHSLPVGFPDDAVQILESGRQEGAERPLHSDCLSLCEAQEVGTTNAQHGAGLGRVEGNQVELWEQARLVTSPSAGSQNGKVNGVPLGLKCDGGQGSQEQEVSVEW